MVICETARLQVSHFTLDDAAFVLRLLNEPSFIRAIADKGVRTPDAARAYLATGPLPSYVRNGFGLCSVSLNSTGHALGL